MVLIAETTAGYSLAFKLSEPPTDEDQRRLVALMAVSPALEGATWTGRAGEDVR